MTPRCASNRRTAPDIYRGVVPITREPGEALALGGSGPPIDWVIEMNRFPQEALFDRLAAAGRLDLELMPSLAAAIAEFHRVADQRTDHGGTPDRHGSSKGMPRASLSTVRTS